jgi:hypothetical protein
MNNGEKLYEALRLLGEVCASTKSDELERVERDLETVAGDEFDVYYEPLLHIEIRD